jgi:hypothetical protein
LTKKIFCCRASSVSQGNSSRHPPKQKGLVTPLHIARVSRNENRMHMLEGQGGTFPHVFSWKVPDI